MSVIVVTPPEPIVSLEVARAHLRVDGAYDDAYIEALVAAATGWIDGPGGGWLGRALGRQMLELSRCSWEAGAICLPYPPIAEIVEVRYRASPESYVTVDPSVYELTAGHILSPRPGKSWPSVLTGADAIKVEYVAGYGADVPKPVMVAILLLVGHWYARREAVSEGGVVELPFAVEALLSPFRLWA